MEGLKLAANIHADDIRTLAHLLWEEAGKPEGKEDHFWLEAERQLKERQIRDGVTTPDNL
jgi:hypothetical protein